MVAWPVSTRVGNVKNNDPSLIEPNRWPFALVVPNESLTIEQGLMRTISANWHGAAALSRRLQSYRR